MGRGVGLEEIGGCVYCIERTARVDGELGVGVGINGIEDG
jgi:hypothetical protein